MAWLNVIQVPQLYKKSPQDLNRSYRLCSRHFSQKNYTNGTSSSRLLQNALPDQNLNCVATIPPISSSITPTDSNGEVASQASKCDKDIKPGIDYKSAPELPVAISYLQYMESGFGSLKYATEDDSHAYTDLNYRKQNTSDQNAEPTEEEQQQQPCTTFEDAASKATIPSTMLRQCSMKLAWIKHCAQVMKLHIPSPEPQSLSTSVVGKLSGIQRMLSYKKMEGLRKPGIIYVSGFMSGMAGKKPTSLHSFCYKYGFPYTRYDATGLGESANEVKLTEARFTHWLEDAEHMLLNHTEGPQLVIASSMGAWISSILVQKYPEKFHSLLLIAPAVNFASRYMKVMSEKLPPTILEKLNRGEVFNYYDPDYGNIPLSLSLFHDMHKYEVDLEKGIAVNCPVKIIHGMKDKDSPYMNSLDLVKAYETEDVELLFIKNGRHQLSEANNLEVIYDTILRMTTSSSKM